MVNKLDDKISAEWLIQAAAAVFALRARKLSRLCVRIGALRYRGVATHLVRKEQQQEEQQRRLGGSLSRSLILQKCGYYDFC